MTLSVDVTLNKSSSCIFFVGMIIVVVEIQCFSLSSDLTRPHDQRVNKHYGWNPLTASHQLAKFGGHSHCGSGDIMILGSHVIS